MCKMTKYNLPDRVPFVSYISVVLVVLSGRSFTLSLRPESVPQDLPVVPVRLNNNKPLILSRGGQLALQNSFTVNSSVTNSGGGCEISHVYKPQFSCGEVLPSVFPCDYEGAITFQHHGCLLDKQLVTLQLSSVISPANFSDVNIHIFSIELQVINHDMLSSIRLDQIVVNSEKLASNKTVHTYRLIFPPEIIGKCYYEILDDFQHLNLPMYGELLPFTNTLLPCGFAQYRLQYKRDDDYTFALVDYILLRMYFYSESSHVVIHYAPIALSKYSKDPVDKEVLTSRMPKTFTVEQAANTLVTPSNIIDGINPIKYIVEVHPLIGSFRAPQSTELSASFTEFTEEDLLSGYVSFYPQYNSPRYSPSRFRFIAVYDALGSISMEDEVIVTSKPLVFVDQAVQRTSKPLQVIKGGIVWIDSLTYKFYLHVYGKCTLNYTKIRLAVPPQHGNIAQSNGSQVDVNATFSVKLVSNGSTLMYKHFGDENNFDQMVWEVICLNAPVLRIAIAVLVARVDNAQPVHFNSTEMFTYKGWSQPLTLSNFKVAGGHSIVGNALINVNHANGTLVKTSHALEFSKVSWLFPLVRLDPSEFSMATSFLLSDVQQQLVWYITPNELHNDTIEISLTDTHGNKANTSINVYISQQKINKTILVSTTDDYPSVHTKSSNMRVISNQPVYITTRYLHSVLAPFSDENIVYFVTSHLQNGTLCIMSPTTCLFSVPQFSQQDVNRQKLYFMPAENFTRETITFEITVSNFKLNFPQVAKIEIKKIQNIGKDVKTFWIRDGKEKRLRPDHFPVFPEAAKFVVTQGTEYGMLSFRSNGSNSNLLEFYHEDLVNRRVWYTHNSAKRACSDSFKFNVVVKNDEAESFPFLILIRKSRKQLAFTISDRPYRIFENSQFLVRKESFLVESSFCPEFVTFNIVAPPQLGFLSLIDMEFGVVVQLNKNSIFTLKDVISGLVHYTLLDSHLLCKHNMSDFFIVNASDPVSSWPLERRQTPRVGRFELLIDTKSEVTENLDLKIKTPRTVSWLPEYKKYGAVLGQSDIDITNSSVDPTEVNIQVNFDLNFYYQLEIDSNSVSVFTLDDIYSRRVIFVKIMLQDNDFRDTITFDVNVEIEIRNETFTALGGTHLLTFVWALIQFDTEHMTVSEERQLVNIRIR